MSKHSLSRQPFNFCHINTFSARNTASVNKSIKDKNNTNMSVKGKENITKSKSQQKFDIYQSLPEDKNFNLKYPIRNEIKNEENNKDNKRDRLDDKASYAESFYVSNTYFNSKPHFDQKDQQQISDNVKETVKQQQVKNEKHNSLKQKQTLKQTNPMIKSGYGTVHNPQLQYLKPSEKIDFANLYNIGKYWSKFEGSFLNGNKSGPGNIYLTSGALFSGYFLNDVAHGRGAVYINGDLKLRGIWKQNKLVTNF